MKVKSQKRKAALLVAMAFAVTTSYMPIDFVEAGLVNNNSKIEICGEDFLRYIPKNSPYDSKLKNKTQSCENNLNNKNRDDKNNDEIKLLKVKPKGKRKDSDGDGISDIRENMVGSNPYNIDSNGNGISDKDEFYDAIIGLEGYEKDKNVDVSISCKLTGKNIDDVILANMEGAHSFVTKDIPGYIGAPFRVGMYKEKVKQDAKVNFKVNTEVTKGKKIALYVYDENVQVLNKVENCEIRNNSEIILNTTLTHDYKEYVVLLEDYWNEAWSKEVISPNRKLIENNTVLLIDSIQKNEDIKIVKNEAIKFIDNIQGENKAALVNSNGKDSIVQELTNGKNDLLSAMNIMNLAGNENTGIENSLKYAIKVLNPDVTFTESVQAIKK